MYSNCCKKPLYKELDVCSKCGEHSEPVKLCEYCDNGYTKIENFPSSYPHKKYIWKTCEICNGEGFINNLDKDYRD